MKMTSCDICTILKNKEMFKFVYEDELCFAILHESPAVEGHTLVIPKEHCPIIEELDDNIVEHLFNVCNIISTALFETLGAHGTNIVLNNGTDAGQELPHLVINVLPRKENDNLNFEWSAKQATNEQLQGVKANLKVYSKAIYSGKDSLPKVKMMPEKGKEKHEKKDKKEDEDYLAKQLNRMP